MAKDTRKTAGVREKAVRSKSSTSKKRRKGRGRRIILITATVFMLLVAVLVFVLAQALLAGSGHRDKTQSDVNVYDTTPTALQGKMAYYVIGLLGEDETSPTEMLTIVCYDKEEKTLNFLEVPQDTYLGDSDLWSVKKAGYVWGNPAPLDWCDFEGKRIYKAEVEEHRNAGHTVSQRTGSASYNLASVFNELFALPVDQYFMIPQQGFVKLVDLVGGVSVDLESSLKVGETTYKKGVNTLDGQAALQYVLKRDKGVKGDIARIVRQRKVFLALFQRLCAQSKQELTEDSVGPVMKGSTPVRVRGDLATATMIDMIVELSAIKPSKMTAQLLPGEISSFNSDSYYSVHRGALITQLNQYFNPYGETITEADIQVTELAKGNPEDVHYQVLSEIALDQNGKIDTTATTQKAE